ncbi:DNA repair protein RecO [Alphaproteobacteria bacterium GH1-50]|uniref:DNA repair protein RecO n=1 Tax=Kangsaoukella pontilimi TaxID=2691042 RepID=A0A7C9MB77_9RHOB|nr:DNA repair protein RecO [Kangsaoukella pontilimi]MXQ08553.1 DNA repair protein RecO [Kangsaoukella pontilimi]
MDWRDEGIVLGIRPHGETSVILDVLTASHGRHAGVVRGGVSRKIAPLLQPGADLDLTWRARLEEHLGAFTVEPLKSRAVLLSDRRALAGLNAVTGLLRFALPEREVHEGLHERTAALLDMMGDSPFWPIAYVRWEVALLEALGFGLDLSACAVTGSTEGLVYVSPRSGRAVSEAGAGEWAERLLPLSPALLGQGTGSGDEIVAGLAVTGHFLSASLQPAMGDRPLPEARARLVDLLGRA